MGKAYKLISENVPLSLGDVICIRQLHTITKELIRHVISVYTFLGIF